MRLQHFISLSSTDELYKFISIYAGPHSWSSLCSPSLLSVVCSFSCVSSLLSLVIAGLDQRAEEKLLNVRLSVCEAFLRLQALHVGKSSSTSCAMAVPGIALNINRTEIYVLMYPTHIDRVQEIHHNAELEMGTECDLCVPNETLSYCE